MNWTSLLVGSSEAALRYEDAMFYTHSDAMIKFHTKATAANLHSFPLYSKKFDFHVIDEETGSSIRSKITEEFGFREHLLSSTYLTGNAWVTEFFITEDHGSILSLARTGNSIRVSFLCRDKEFNGKLTDYFCNLINGEKPTKQVYMLMSTSSGIGLHSIGSIEEALSKQNYTEEVLTKWTSIVSNLESTTPKGRLSIINGPPGVGKTRLIMGLVAEVSSVSNFIIIPPNMISSLVEPSFISVMRSVQGSSILILEDADVCLTRKSRDDMSQLQAVLNFADGIVGQLLDFRLVVTSNVKTEDFDPAILRPGRLCEHIQVGLLGKQEANQLYRELGGVGEPFEGEASLAEIYSFVKDPDREVFTKSRKMGF